MKRLLEEHPNDLAVVFKHNPLGFHKRAMPAAKASMAAHSQGKFWEYHDLLFSQKRFDDATLEGYAQQLGLDMARWNADLRDPVIEAKILHDQQAMVKSGARGTPAFFVNGKYVKGAKPYPAFKAEVEAALKQADAERQKGVKEGDLHRVLATQNASQVFVDWVIDGKPVAGSAPAPRASAGGKGAARQPAAPKGPVEITVHKDDPYKGSKDAPIVIAEWSDFQ